MLRLLLLPFLVWFAFIAEKAHVSSGVGVVAVVAPIAIYGQFLLGGHRIDAVNARQYQRFSSKRRESLLRAGVGQQEFVAREREPHRRLVAFMRDVSTAATVSGLVVIVRAIVN